MSDPFDARVLRSLVRETAAETPAEPNWDALEDRLFARLDDAPTALSLAVDRVEDEDGSEDDTTSVRLSELPAEDRPSPDPLERMIAAAPLPTVAVVVAKRDRVVHMPGAERADADGPSFAEGDDDRNDDRKSSAAIDSFHSPSLILEPATAPRPNAGRRAVAVFGALAVAACLALLVGTLVRKASTPQGPVENASIQQEHWVDPNEIPLAAGLENVRDAAALRQGDIVEATQGAVAFGRKDQWMWTLAPGSRVRIEAPTGPSGDQVIVLQNGSIRASVTGVARSNPLIIQADDAMVSVEGAALPALFTVTRSSKGLAVEVEQGATLLGGRLGGDTHRLGPLDRATLSLDGRDFRLLEPVAVAPVRTSVTADGLTPPSEVRRVDPPAAPPRVETPRAPASVASASVAPTSEPVDPPAVTTWTEASVRSSVTGCIQGLLDKQASTSGVSLSAESSVRFVVDDEGVIRSASFSPPLKPELQACAAGLLRSKVSSGVRSIQFSVSIVGH